MLLMCPSMLLRKLPADEAIDLMEDGKVGMGKEVHLIVFLWNHRCVDKAGASRWWAVAATDRNTINTYQLLELYKYKTVQQDGHYRIDLSSVGKNNHICLIWITTW